jgi:hypothetical protein
MPGARKINGGGVDLGKDSRSINAGLLKSVIERKESSSPTLNNLSQELNEAEVLQTESIVVDYLWHYCKYE